jgi:hypothetical protein
MKITFFESEDAAGLIVCGSTVLYMHLPRRRVRMCVQGPADGAGGGGDEGRGRGSHEQ